MRQANRLRAYVADVVSLTNWPWDVADTTSMRDMELVVAKIARRLSRESGEAHVRDMTEDEVDQANEARAFLREIGVV